MNNFVLGIFVSFIVGFFSFILPALIFKAIIKNKDVDKRLYIASSLMISIMLQIIINTILATIIEYIIAMTIIGLLIFTYPVIKIIKD